MDVFWFIFFWLAFSVAVGIFAAKRGRDGFLWVVISLFISPLLGFIFVAASANLMEQEKEEAAEREKAEELANSKKCPQCAELVKLEAKICRFCGHQFDQDELPAISTHREALGGPIKSKKPKPVFGKVALAFIAGIPLAVIVVGFVSEYLSGVRVFGIRIVGIAEANLLYLVFVSTPVVTAIITYILISKRSPNSLSKEQAYPPDDKSDDRRGVD